MPIIHIHLVEGRDGDAKSRLVQKVTDAVEQALAVPRPTVRVLLHEVPPASWAVGGVPLLQDDQGNLQAIGNSSALSGRDGAAV
jgi:4-oxalocrotonate tautomerase